MENLRHRITALNLVITGIVLLFFALAPLFGFPATWDESLGLALSITPVFLGNIGFAAAFAAQHSPVEISQFNDERIRLIALLSFGSIVVFLIVAVAACTAFWISNRPGLIATGTGMGLQTLQASIAASLSINTVISNHLIARIFPVRMRVSKNKV